MDGMFKLSSRPLLQFQEAILLRMAAQTPIFNRGHSESLPFEEWRNSMMDQFPSVSFAVDMADVKMCSFCLLTSMELISYTRHSLLCLHSNDMKSLKRVLHKRKGSYNYN